LCQDDTRREEEIQNYGNRAHETGVENSSLFGLILYSFRRWFRERMTCQEKSKLFFLLSGEHSELPQAEVKAILESEHFPYTIVRSDYRLLEAESSLKALERVGDRSLMVESCGQVISDIECDRSSVKRIHEPTNLLSFLHEGESFAVRSIRLGGAEKGIRREQLERDLGKLISDELKTVKVDLRKPNKTFLAIVSPGRVTLGLLRHKREPGIVHRRRPRKRPYFHPSTMQPKLARCMVNLARPRPGEVLLDPFCGVGGHLIEAGLMGCRVVGVDVNRRMVLATSRNLRYFGVKPEGLVEGDGRKLPFSRVHSIATDPPYGRGASTIGSTPKELLTNFLSDARSILERGSFICLAAAKKTGVIDIADTIGFEIVQSYEIYVHRSLTRQIVVLNWN
jgi:tRNA (guanine10-N2)-dimethyltransferase